MKCRKLLFYMVPCRQAEHSGDRREQNLVLSWSPDHERHLTFRSQKKLIIQLSQSFMKAWKPGDLRSNSLAGPYRRLGTEDTSENDMARYPTGRLCNLGSCREQALLCFHIGCMRFVKLIMQVLNLRFNGI